MILLRAILYLKVLHYTKKKDNTYNFSEQKKNWG